MSSTKSGTSGKTPQTTPLPATQSVTPLFMHAGFPVFLGVKGLTLNEIDKLGYPMYWVLGMGAEEITSGTTKRTVVHPTLWKVMNTRWGKCSIETSLEELDIKQVYKEESQFDLPLISWVFVEKMDKFFRAVFEDLGTEGTVMLTYDYTQLASVNPEDGWDFFVPDQENTAGGCKYQMDQILEHVAENNVELVGSAHSHPEMTAYFSSVDHTDQADFEGLHITCGWYKGQASQWYAEIVLGGKQWPKAISSIFQPYPKPTLEPFNFEADLLKVKKAAPTIIVSGFGGTRGGGTTNWQHGTSTTPNKRKDPFLILPSEAPDPRVTTIIAVMGLDEDAYCRFCSAPFTEDSMRYRRCYACDGFFIHEEESLADLIEHRNLNHVSYNPLIDIEAAVNPIVLWRKVQANTKAKTIIDSFEQVHPGIAVQAGVGDAKK